MDGLTRPPGLTEQLVQALEQEIGGRVPGARLPTEKQLGERFAVSRAVVREAIARLKADGYVETRQGAGAFIAKKPGLRSFKLVTETARTPADLQHILELRMAVEVAAAELAARRRTERDLADIRAALQAMTEAIRRETDGSEADDRFHAAIARATHNPYLPRFVAFLRHHFWETRRPTWGATGYRTGQPHTAQREHQRLVVAIAAGDPRAARKAARTHLLSSASRLGLSSGRSENFLDDRSAPARRRRSS